MPLLDRHRTRWVLPLGLVACRPEPATSPTSPPATIDKASIRAVVRAHIGEVRACYNDGLAYAPDMTGRVTLRFELRPDGGVQRLVIQSSTLPSGTNFVARCIARRFRRWRFPTHPGPGVIIVTYPFILEPSEPESSEES